MDVEEGGGVFLGLVLNRPQSPVDLFKAFVVINNFYKFKYLGFLLDLSVIQGLHHLRESSIVNGDELISVAE